RRPPTRPLFPYTTLFRSLARGRVEAEPEEPDAEILAHGSNLALVHLELGPRLVDRPKGSARDLELGARLEGDRSPVPLEREERRSEEHTSELQSRENLVC